MHRDRVLGDDVARERHSYIAIALLFVLGLATVVWLNRATMNHDGVSYLSLADHYLTGRYDLAVSGSWSPLFVWLLAALAKAIGDPALACRIAMAISAVVFVAGAASVVALIRHRFVRIIAMLAAALTAAQAAGEFITPDLLSAGIFFFACSVLFRLESSGSGRAAFVTGCLFGLSYLAKSALLLSAVALIGATFVAYAWTRAVPPKQLLARFFICIAGLLLVAAPWITVLSVKYEQLTFSTTDRVLKALIAPDHLRLSNPTNRMFIVPESGRQSQAEDESVVAPAIWSPFGSVQSFAYFAARTLKNLPATIEFSRSYDFSGLGLIAGVVFLAGYALRRRSYREAPLGLLILPVAAITATYAPFFIHYVEQRRYFLPVIIFVFICSLEAGRRLGGHLAGNAGARWGVLASFGVLVLSMALALPRQALHSSETQDFLFARQLAPLLKRSEFSGSVAGVPVQKHPAIYLSFELKTTYNGLSTPTTADGILSSCAKLFFTARSSPQQSILDDRRDLFTDIEELVPEARAMLTTTNRKLYWIKLDPRDNERCKPTALR